MPSADLKFHASAIKARIHDARSAAATVSPSVAAVLHDMFGLSNADIAKALSRTHGARGAVRFDALTTGRRRPLLPK